ncbi:MAG: hypothetical protein PVF04_04520 [Anaerolineae bacterium]|jgi:Flp pilus assembly protein TadB
MTSRDVFRTRLEDQLGVKIRRVLRASVADATPPSRVWRRIVEHLNQQAGMRWARRWRGFWLACQGLALWLLDPVVYPPAEFAYCYTPSLGHVRDRGYLRLLVYHCELPVLLGQVM